MSRTKVNFEYTNTKIQLSDGLVFLGSCFAANVGNEFQHRKLNTLVNPLGVVFHPEPLFKQIKRAIKGEFYVESNFFLFDKYWYNFELSGTCAKPDLSEAVAYANNQLKILSEALRSAKKLFITLGTATGYEKDGLIVANCHKQNANEFEKINSEPTKLSTLADEVFKLLQVFNQHVEIVLTVSPVRYKKDGLITNSLSKAVLLLTVNELANQWNIASYLPVYELVIDELRDYKYFETDGVHPNVEAVKYVFNEMAKKVCDERLLDYLCAHGKMMQQINHKSIHMFSNSNISFLSNLLNFIAETQNEFKVDLTFELEEVKRRYKNATTLA